MILFLMAPDKELASELFSGMYRWRAKWCAAAMQLRTGYFAGTKFGKQRGMNSSIIVPGPFIFYTSGVLLF